MDNQHKKIKGYRDLTQQEIDLMNKVKEKAEEVGCLIDELNQYNLEMVDNKLDGRWLSIGITDLQKGFMALVRSIAKPESF